MRPFFQLSPRHSYVTYGVLHRRYLVAADEKQATFTGCQQRAGVFILPFAVHGLFGFGKPRPPRPPDAGHRGGKGGAGRGRGRRRGAAGSRHQRAPPPSAEQAPSNAGAPDPDAPFLLLSDDEDIDPPTGFNFDWDAYATVFGDTPMQDAVTAMFAEYAVLYGRIAGWVTTSRQAPMTVQEAADLSKHAEEFVLHYMTPILGPTHTSKVHKLLRHVLSSIKMHGSLANGNTSGNEAHHKLDKKFYRRTNKSIAKFTGQIVRQAQGTREVLARLKEADAEVLQAATSAGLRDGARGALDAATPAAAGDLPRGGAAARVPNGAVGASSRSDRGQAPLALPALPPRPRRNRLRLTVRDLSRRPGLQGLAAALDCLPTLKVGVVPSKKITAHLECGWPLTQIVRASSSFHGTPWYDAVFYTLDTNSTHTEGGGDGASDQAVQYLGEVRAIINGADEDIAVICNMSPVECAPSCPLSARECMRFKWAVPASGDEWSIALVPIRRIVRVVHLVPDFGDVLRRRGPFALPTAIGGPVNDLRAMHYFVNPFYPWGR